MKWYIFFSTVKLDFKNRHDKNQLGFKNHQDKNILTLRTKIAVTKNVLKVKFDCTFELYSTPKHFLIM